MSTTYKEFARFYTKGDWPRYSAQMARILPSVMEHFGLWPRKILDLACGEGTFAVTMANMGLQVTGVDLSPEMLEIARQRAATEGVRVKFLHQDMRSLSLRGRFHLITCWFDSLNYLLEIDDLSRTFAGVSRVLDENGIFIFDVNTIRALAVEWVREPSYVHLNSGDSFLVSVPQYDAATRIASLHITGFAKQNKRWVRMDEVHKERGYALKEIRQCLKRADLHELACWASLDKMDRPRRNTARVWFVACR
jgi:ubiquinone/menaquinone biosynthesis C-methylase UbiE